MGCWDYTPRFRTLDKLSQILPDVRPRLVGRTVRNLSGWHGRILALEGDQVLVEFPPPSKDACIKWLPLRWVWLTEEVG